MDINDLARYGAAVRIAELEREIEELRRAFPEIGVARRNETLRKNLALARDAKARKRNQKAKG